ncbi:P-loop containing nucleoside triphosphate hydrolase [Pseudocohnilembus persalinus]|uniref:RNA helicase n=1 Tax=Pseudocohnilembus persalinus TaxID=266149 RepID=A0A0V0QG56_PSEPJ|nr:P-loop containing nucleoside triphosphate hydrolase [Pseudocohnilembus persalinus]|eukprot:KRX01164.1 P-loop containing nucleoside triphosphate hydrolase [Pseudocohnilembus persalinus]
MKEVQKNQLFRQGSKNQQDNENYFSLIQQQKEQKTQEQQEINSQTQNQFKTTAFNKKQIQIENIQQDKQQQNDQQYYSEKKIEINQDVKSNQNNREDVNKEQIHINEDKKNEIMKLKEDQIELQNIFDSSKSNKISDNSKKYELKVFLPESDLRQNEKKLQQQQQQSQNKQDFSQIKNIQDEQEMDKKNVLIQNHNLGQIQQYNNQDSGSENLDCEDEERQLDDDFDEEKYFNEDDEDQQVVQQNNNADDDEPDELDLLMQNMEDQAQKEVQEIGKDLKRKPKERLENDDYGEDYMEVRKKKIITEASKAANRQVDDPDDPNNWDLMDSDGEVDLDAVKKMKKQNFQMLDNIDFSKMQQEPFEKNFYQEHEDIKSMTEEQVKKIRNDHSVKVTGKQVPKPVISFGYFNFDESMLNQIAKQGFQQPTAIQSQALPCILSGRDVVGVAKTGSGKTLAYIWPMIIHLLDQRIVDRNEGPVGVVLCPTRELSQQVYMETKRYARLFNVDVTALLGGENKKDQWKNLKAGTDIIVATPGRLMEMIQKKATNLLRCTYVVVDEADKMFSMGFEKQIRSILSNIRPDRQTLLFTATLKKNIQNLVMDVLNDPVIINVGVQNQANEDVKQEVVVLRNQEDKFRWLKENLLFLMGRGKVIIFVNQINQCEKLKKEIIEHIKYYDVLTLHGDKLQQERTQIINEFKQDKMLMIATDVASRGLDVPQIRTVVNYENPKDGDTHIHRVGRTGRAGDKMGTAYSLMTDMDIKFAVMLLKNFEVSGQTVPPELEAVAMKDDKFKLKKMTAKIGLQYAKGKDASKLLKQALSRQRKTKEGLGFEKDQKQSQQDKIRKEADKMILQQRMQQEEEMKQKQLQQLQLQEQEQWRNQFQNSGQVEVKGGQMVPQRGFSRALPQNQEFQQSSVKTEREKIEHEFQQRQKNTLKASFRSSFQSAGVQQQNKTDTPKVSYLSNFKKGKK